MALRLAGTPFLAIQGTDNQGWVREVTSLDTLPGLKVNQQGTGRVFDFQDGGISKLYLPDGGDVSLVGNLVFDLANDVTITPSNPSAPRTLTLPAVGQNSTFAFLQEAQTFTALQTFSSGIDLGSSGTLLNVGAAGNDWTANQMKVENSNPGAAVDVQAINSDNTNGASHALLYLASGGINGGDAYVRFDLSTGGTGDWTMGLDNSNSDAFVLSMATALGTNDAFRVTAATPPVITYNTTHPTGTFDYVCEGCGKHDAEPFKCCGPVEWHDDVMDFRALVLRKPGALDYMERIGVMERTFDNDGKPELFTVLGADWMFAASKAWQNRQRMDARYEEMNKRLEAIGA